MHKLGSPKGWQWQRPYESIDHFPAPLCKKCKVVTLAINYERDSNSRWIANLIRFKCVHCEKYFWRRFETREKFKTFYKKPKEIKE